MTPSQCYIFFKPSWAAKDIKHLKARQWWLLDVFNSYPWSTVPTRISAVQFIRKEESHDKCPSASMDSGWCANRISRTFGIQSIIRLRGSRFFANVNISQLHSCVSSMSRSTRESKMVSINEAVAITLSQAVHAGRATSDICWYQYRMLSDIWVHDEGEDNSCGHIRYMLPGARSS